MKIARVVGIDVSLTSTGVAAATLAPSEVRYAAGVIETKGYRDDPVHQRAERIRTIRLGVADWLYGGPLNSSAPPVLSIIEGPSHGSSGGSAWDRAGLWWGIVRQALTLGPVAVVAPTTRAKWATGNGRADKAAVGAAVARMLPGMDIGGSDEADALCLAIMGAQKLGWTHAANAKQYAALDAVRWPEIPEVDG